MVDYVLCKENQGVYHDYNIRHSTDLNEAGKYGWMQTSLLQSEFPSPGKDF